MPKQDTVNGVTGAIVNLPDGAQTFVRRGDSLPESVGADERKRLARYGVFDEPKGSTPAATAAGVVTDDAERRKLTTERDAALAERDEHAAKVAELEAKLSAGPAATGPQAARVAAPTAAPPVPVDAKGKPTGGKQ